MPATALEQLLLELLNRARLDPAAEAARFGISLNEGLSPNTISPVSKQPLAMNEALLSAARAHSQDMIDRDYFDHNTPEGVTPFQRIANAGYSAISSGENIAVRSTSGTVTTALTLMLHQDFFVDSTVPGRGHRLGMLTAGFQEVGVGQVTGNFQGFNGTMVTQDFAVAGGRQFLTGVSYADLDHDNFYSIGEGRNGMTVTAGASTSTGAAGGYSLQVGTGVQNVTFSGGGLSSPISVGVTILANTNAKVDVVDQNVVYTSASLTDLGGAATIIGLGTIGLSLTGDGGNDTIFGTKGNDTLNGAGGTDTAVFSGLRSAYTLTNLGGGNVRVSGPDGLDTLSGIERLQFGDATLGASATVFDPLAFKLAGFGPGAGGWTSEDRYPRDVADVNGDGFGDIVGFGDAGVFVSLGSATGFGAIGHRLAAFGLNNGGWGSQDKYPRHLADVNGDGLADIVGFGDAGVFVSLATGGGSFGPATHRLAAFGAVNGGWFSDDRYHRELADVNGDGMADIVGFGDAGVFVSLATGGGTFGSVTHRLAAFGAVNGGWNSQNTYPRHLADVNGDGKADIVGFGDAGVYVALATSGGNFGPISFGLAGFGRNNGWVSDNLYPRELADVNGDGKADIVGFGDAGVWVGLSDGTGSFQPIAPDLQAFGQNGGWSSDNTYPRVLADINHDHMADIVGFGQAGVYAALSSGFHLI